MSKSARAMCVAVVVVLALAGAVDAVDARLVVLAPAAFELESTLQLNDAARTDREVGYKVRARLTVQPRWAAPDHSGFLLQFHLQSPKLYLRGKHVNAEFMPYDSVWDTHGDSSFYAHWSRGEIKVAYLDPDELPDVLNYKKALLSLFQVQMLDGEYNETDVSGPCRVLYETISTEVFRKIKRSCASDGAGGVSSSRRVARYSLDAGGLAALHAEELLHVGPAALGLKARSWHSLRRAGPGPQPPAAPLPGLQAALQELPAALRELSLTLQAPPEDADDEELNVTLEQARSALAGDAAGQGGTAAEAAVALQLLPALRRANHSAALQLLQRADMHDHLSGLCRLLGLAATGATHRAADEFLQLHAPEPLAELARTYLAGLAQAPRPAQAVVLDALRLAARPGPLRPAALLAAAGAARACAGAAPAVRAALRDGLARCGDAACRALRLRALGCLPGAEPELLLQHAARAEPGPALQALRALGAAPPGALTFARLDRLQALALNASGALEVRAAALELLVRRRAGLPAPLARVAQALYARGEHELQRVLWQRVASLAPAHGALAALPAQLTPLLRGWDARAHGGSSSVLARAPGWALGGWSAELVSLQVARAGLLRRGEVRLLARDELGNTFDVLDVDVWTRGLEAFGGGNDDASASSAAESSQPTGELGLGVAGARLPTIALFDGQAELLAHVWAGTASAPTPVLRALRPLHEQYAHVPLLAGASARLHARAALALALDAQAQVSLWWRSARAELRLRAGLAAQAALRVRTAWAQLGARADVRVEPRLRIAADLDFYSGVALCVRVSTEPQWRVRRVALRGEGGARRLRVRRVREGREGLPGRTLALGRPNDVTCRTLRAADADADTDADADAGSH